MHQPLLRSFARLSFIRLSSLTAVASAFVLAAAQAQPVVPDAGRVLQEPRAPLPPPAPRAPALTVDRPVAGAVSEGGARARLTALRFSGNTAFGNEALQALLADALDRDLSFAELGRLAERITRHYRAAGYLVARAYLPAQELRDGVLHIAVLEGTLGQVEVRNDAGLNPSALAPLAQLPLNAAVQEQTLERVLYILADLPGTAVQSTLRPGTAVGASDLLVEVARTQSFQGSADLDNFGSRYTGEYRVGTSLYWNNPLDRGDQLSLRLQASDARLRYERIGYQLPVGAWGTRVGIAYSDMYYRLGKDFAALDADGTAKVTSLYLRHPFVRSRTANWYGQLQYDDKSLKDAIGSTATVARHELRNMVFGLNGEWQDGWFGGGGNALALNLTRGRAHLDAGSSLQDAVSARSAGSFTKLGYQLQRLQVLTPGLGLALSATGQFANRNLVSAEKFSLGGSQGVRAFAQGEASGDEGWLASAELRWQPMPGWQFKAFYDAGGVKINRQPWANADNRRRLAGAGLGMGWASGKTAFTLTAAWPTRRDAAVLTARSQHGGRFWGQMTVAF